MNSSQARSATLYEWYRCTLAPWLSRISIRKVSFPKSVKLFTRAKISIYHVPNDKKNIGDKQRLSYSQSNTILIFRLGMKWWWSRSDEIVKAEYDIFISFWRQKLGILIILCKFAASFRRQDILRKRLALFCAKESRQFKCGMKKDITTSFGWSVWLRHIPPKVWAVILFCHMGSREPLDGNWTNLLTLLFYALITVWKIAQIEQNVQKSCPSHPFEGKVLKLFGSMKH